MPHQQLYGYMAECTRGLGSNVRCVGVYDMNRLIRRFLSILALSAFLAGCSGSEPQHKASDSGTSQQQPIAGVPKYLLARPSELYVRDGDKIVNAPAEDISVARRYPEFQDKGELRKGQRITIMTAKTTYRLEEEVRVIHVLESPEAGHELHVMGPKQIQNEFVDGKLASPARTGLAVYNGRVMKSHGVDFNYEISSYTFDKPGEHTIEWKGGGHPIQADLKLESNVLRITVTE